jgi:hypothetical protein
VLDFSEALQKAVFFTESLLRNSRKGKQRCFSIFDLAIGKIQVLVEHSDGSRCLFVKTSIKLIENVFRKVSYELLHDLIRDVVGLPFHPCRLRDMV